MTTIIIIMINTIKRAPTATPIRATGTPVPERKREREIAVMNG